MSAVITLKLKQIGLTAEKCLPKDTDGIANSEDPNQTAPPLGAVLLGFAKFAQTCLSKNLESLWYTEENAPKECRRNGKQ